MRFGFVFVVRITIVEGATEPKRYVDMVSGRLMSSGIVSAVRVEVSARVIGREARLAGHSEEAEDVE